MWSEWLTRTLNPRRDEAPDEAAPRRRRHGLALPPDLEADGMHPGADDFRGALGRMGAEVE
jgi:hypothetical protein